MSRTNVGRPRFYINVLEWLSATGFITTLENLNRTLPVKLERLPSTGEPFSDYNIDPHAFLGNKTFFAVLGHRGFAQDVSGRLRFDAIYHGPNNQDEDWVMLLDNIVNSELDAVAWKANYNGFSIGTFRGDAFQGGLGGADTLLVRNTSGVSTPLYAGSIIIGTYYDMPHYPDLSLTMEIEYGGIKTIETKGGASLSNATYTKPPAWGLIEAWGLQSGETGQITTGRSGRRIWSLSFSYIQDSDLFPEISSNEPYESTSSSGELHPTGDWWQGNALLDSDTFFSQVIHKTNGGQLPFIFQPDGDGDTPGSGNNNPDQFAICKLNMKSIKFQQQAPNLYRVSLKIREVW